MKPLPWLDAVADAVAAADGDPGALRRARAALAELGLASAHGIANRLAAYAAEPRIAAALEGREPEPDAAALAAALAAIRPILSASGVRADWLDRYIDILRSEPSISCLSLGDRFRQTRRRSKPRQSREVRPMTRDEQISAGERLAERIRSESLSDEHQSHGRAIDEIDADWVTAAVAIAAAKALSGQAPKTKAAALERIRAWDWRRRTGRRSIEALGEAAQTL